jgi:ribosome maturation factor RimP
LLEPLIREAGMDLESVRISAAGRCRLLRVVIDADGGVGLDEIAEISRDVSARLDSTGAMGEAPYTLEVSSPGVDRPLTEPRHWRRARGHLVNVPLATSQSSLAFPQPDGSGPAPAPALRGRVVVADDQRVTLEVDGQHQQFAYSELGPGRVQVEFARPGQDSGRDGVIAPAGSGEGGSPDGH